MIVQIVLNGIKLYAYHGVLPQERKTGSDYTLNLLLTAPLDKALSDDDINSTIDYAAVHRIVEREMKVPSRLIEYAAGRIIRAVKENFPQITEIELSLSKLTPPMESGQIHSATVILKEKY